MSGRKRWPPRFRKPEKPVTDGIWTRVGGGWFGSQNHVWGTTQAKVKEAGPEFTLPVSGERARDHLWRPWPGYGWTLRLDGATYHIREGD